MKAPTLKSAAQWRVEQPGAKALLLSPSAPNIPNTTFILAAAEPAPEGRFRLHGRLD